MTKGERLHTSVSLLAHDAVRAQAYIHLLQVDVHIASTCAAAGGHSQEGESRVPGQLRGRTAAFRGLDAVVKIHRHVPLPLPCPVRVTGITAWHKGGAQF